MIKFKDKKIYFSGRGYMCGKEELIKYLIQSEAELIDDIVSSDMIIQGYLTPVHMEDKFYLFSKEGKEVITIEQLEKQFSTDMDIDSVIMAIKISKDQTRLLELLNNSYFSNDIFVQLLKYYNWNNMGLHDNDENRDVSTNIVNRFCSLQQTNHNIQHSPVGVYYTALETTDGNLLKIVYNMPDYKISDKNAYNDQPLSLKQVVALNPNTPKPLLMQILKNGNKDELKFLALNESINKTICNTLYDLKEFTVTTNLIRSGNLPLENINELLEEDLLKNELLKYVDLNDEIFNKLVTSNLSDEDIVYLSLNSSISVIQINKLFEFNIENANINLLKNGNCPKAKIEEFFNKNDLIYNIAIAHNENLDEYFFEKLLMLEDINIEMSLSTNKNTPQVILKKLYGKNIHEINTLLSQNENTPIGILMQLQVDGRYSVYVSNNETYREFSRNNLGIIQQNNSRFKKDTYGDFWDKL